MRLIAPVLFASILAACSGGKTPSDDSADTGADTGSDTDTDTTVDTPYPLRADTVADAYRIVVVPGLVYLSSFFSAYGDGVCPTIVTETETEFAVQGDCTASDGTTYVGSFQVLLTSETSGTVTYAGWGFTTPDGEMLFAEGTHGLGANSFTATGDQTLHVDLEYPASEDFPSMSLSADWTNFDIGLGGGDGSTPVNAHVVVAEGPEVGVLDASGSFVYESTCGGPVSGTVVLSGSQDVYLAPQGCDENACIPWTAADGTTGEICE
jgi:hypothetical protein